MVVTLGGGIELRGFDDVDDGELIIVKKIVGQYARQLSDGFPAYEELVVDIAGDDELTVTATVNDDITATVEHGNLFIALDAVLQDVVEQAIP